MTVLFIFAIFVSFHIILYVTHIFSNAFLLKFFLCFLYHRTVLFIFAIFVNLHLMHVTHVFSNAFLLKYFLCFLYDMTVLFIFAIFVNFRLLLFVIQVFSNAFCIYSIY